VSLVVADSGPVQYLILCEAIHVVPQIYGQLVIPSAVARELSHSRTPPKVQAWIRALPQWASVRHPNQAEPTAHLGLGECEAIALARELKATQLLVDDRAARRIAVQRGLAITGTVGILEQAAERGLISLPTALQKILRTNFRIDADVIRQALERDRLR
jgi:Predicted nucleic acid-binding protein, contains PIN domain